MKYSNNSNAFFIALCFMVITFCSCKKDKGTYDVQPINRITIDLDSTYYLNKGEHLIIRPVIKYSKDESGDTLNYQYEWSYGDASLSKNRDLDFSDRIFTTAELSAGIYQVYYRITDKKTGVFSDKYINIKISTPIYEGWLTLCEQQDGSGRLDMISNSTGRDTLYKDILKKMKSNYTLSGAPRFVYYTGQFNYHIDNGNFGINKGIGIGTSTSWSLLDQDSLKLFPTGLLGPNKITPDMMMLSSFADGVYDKNNDYNVFYVSNSLWDVGATFPLSRINMLDNVPFTPSPWTAISSKKNSQGGVDIIIFNQDTKTFLRYNTATHVIDPLPADPLPANILFNFATGMDLQYMDFVQYQGGLVFAILKNRSSGKRYMASFTTDGKQIAYDELLAEGISDDSKFAISANQGYLLYTSGNKVYEYDPVLKQSFLMKDYGNRNVTVFKFQKFLDAAVNIKSYKVLSDKLLVATYLPGDLSSSGTLDLFTVPDINAQFQIYKSYSGLGKIVSVAYMQK